MLTSVAGGAVRGQVAGLMCVMPRRFTPPGVFVEEVSSGMRPIAGVTTSTTAFVGEASRGPLGRAVGMSSFADYEHEFGGLDPDSDISYAVYQFFLNGGRAAYAVRIAGDPQDGLRALDAVDDLNILSIPGTSDPTVMANATAYCEKRRAFLIIDPPAAAGDPAAMETLVTGADLPKSSHAAVYWPWLEIDNPLRRGESRPVPPSGTVAGVYARTDAQRGVWKAPAGVEATLRGVHSPTYLLSEAEAGTLNPRGVNALRTLPGAGPVIWGARTLRPDDDPTDQYKYVAVRRTALFIEESLHRGTQWVVFEPNDEPLWSQLRLNIGDFMHNLFREGAFQGTTAREAYFVKVGRDTTTQADVDRGIVNILVGFAPLKPAEFVVISIRQSTRRR